MRGENGPLRRLPGRSRWGFGLITSVQHRLWEADDHVLLVVTQGFREMYRRFAYRDIQALIVNRTRTGRVANFLLGALALLLLGAAALVELAGGAGVGIVVFGFPAVAFVLALVGNTLLGPTCVFRIHTAVSSAEIECLRRWRTANKVLTRLAARIEAVQGRFESGGEGGGPSGAVLNASSYETPALAPGPAALERGVREDSGRLHQIAFIALLAGGVLWLLDFAHTRVAKDMADTTLFFGAAALLMACAVRQHGSSIPDRAKSLTWVGLALLGVTLASTMAIMILLSLDDRPLIHEVTAAGMLYEYPELAALLFVSGVLAIGTGTLGLRSLRGARARNTLLRRRQGAFSAGSGSES